MRSSVVGLLVVDRWFRFEEFRRKQSSQPLESAPGNSMTDILRKYRGIDGVCWPDEGNLSHLIDEDGLAPISAVDEVKAYRATHPRAEFLDLIALATPPVEPIGSALPGFVFSGIEVGYYDSPWSSFSSIFHDVLFGRNEQLHRFKERLNSALLLSSPADAQTLIDVRAEQMNAGADLETGIMMPIEIYSCHGGAPTG
jgi:hypothetical protein